MTMRTALAEMIDILVSAEVSYVLRAPTLLTTRRAVSESLKVLPESCDL